MSNDSILPTGQRRDVLQTVGGLAGFALIGSTSAAGAGDNGDVEGYGAVEDGRYALPELPYEYDALEPHIDERIMELHHSVHHQGYVDGANAALDTFEEMRSEGDYEDVKAAKRDFSFNLSGHINHTIFWQNMSPDGGGEPDGELGAAIDEQFGSFEAFREEFTAAAENVESNGWAMLFYEPVADLLVIGQIESQNGLAHQGAIPILTLDVWEHAYYLQYENERGSYVEEWWNVVDWDDVCRRYEFLTQTRADEVSDGKAEKDTDEE
ncbi:superoxide dismutase [Natronococcus occultus]|uniref:superoxide dismutase n=1 Tax=Natronococcus occultus SP4 TaxID=694430 RepID=L0JXL3_9EURY|nr:superoxide dismutase [Natronococcus occultus]AGB37501.1 superoxide dismutase [Natronococcus occultus SP4]